MLVKLTVVLWSVGISTCMLLHWGGHIMGFELGVDRKLFGREERGINNDLMKNHKVEISNLLPSLTRMMCVCVCKNDFYMHSVIGDQRYFLCLESLSIRMVISTLRVASNVKYL